MIGRPHWHFESVDSTQSTVFSLANMGAPHGTVVSADYQRAGRGREGRPWEAPAGSSLMFSVLLRRSGDELIPGTISILIANALAHGFREIVDDPVHIKWPNDVLIDGKKTSGVLIQTRVSVEPVAVLGIGINIDLPAEHLPEGATCLGEHSVTPIDESVLLTSVLTKLQIMWQSLSPTLSPEQISELDDHLWLKGEMVSILDGRREIRGEILGIAESGGLRILEDGSERTIMAGEITRGPRPILEG